jgi:hypothetical protein
MVVNDKNFENFLTTFARGDWEKTVKIFEESKNTEAFTNDVNNGIVNHVLTIVDIFSTDIVGRHLL